MYPTSCDGLGIRARIRSEEALLRGARAGCVVDADCRLISAAVPCAASCGSFNHSVLASAVAELNQSVSSIRDDFCTTFESRGCPPPLALPCAPPTTTERAACVSGQCDIQSVPRF